MIVIFKSLFFSFFCAFKGIAYAIVHERNLRIHMALGATMLFFSRYYDFSKAEYCILILTVALVLVTELINTSVEKTVDLESPRYHELAKVAKDVAAGAVLLSAAASVAVGVCLFWEPDILRVIFQDIFGKYFLLFLFFFAAALLFIFCRPQNNHCKQKRRK